MSPRAWQGEPGRGGRGAAVTQPPQLPGEHLQLHLFCIACLTEHPKQFQDYISLSHLFARGVSQAPEVGFPAAPRSLLHTHTQRRTLAETHVQVHLETPGGHPKTHSHAHVVDTQTWGP